MFENLRRKGHHCHGLTHLSWAERKIFTGFWVKNFVGVHLPWTVSAALWLYQLPATGAKQMNGTGHNNGQEPAATT
ncbi:hypothetical protein O6A27_26235 [Escherichia coli]|nr:hypothetical protein [Escherichia coli]